MSDRTQECFSPRVLFATSGAANAGIDNHRIHGVFHGELPPSIEVAVQERGPAGRPPDSSISTYWYVSCILLESYLVFLRRTYTSTVNKPNYRKSLLQELITVLSYLVIPTHCINAVVVDKQLIHS